MILVYFLVMRLAFAGIIFPKTPRPIIASRNNIDTVSDYTFYFQITSYVPENAILSITFPYGYANDLGITTCKATDWNGEAVVCATSNKAAVLEIGEMSNADSENTYFVTVYGVHNPSSAGGTGMFKIETSSGINTIDYSDWFGEIGLTSNIQTIAVASTACTTNCKAGETGTYTVTFINTIKYEIGTRLFIRFPTSLTLDSSPSCLSTQLSTVTCTKDSDNLITFSELIQEISSGTSIVVTFTNVLNPAVSGNVGTFDIYTYQPIVYTMYDAVNGIAGPVLTSNSITSISICPTTGGSCIGYYPHVALGFTQTYTLTFVTTNGVPLGGSIFVT